MNQTAWPGSPHWHSTVLVGLPVTQTRENIQNERPSKMNRMPR